MKAEHQMIQYGIDQQALISKFSEASAKQGDAIRKAVTETTLKALQGRELTLANIKQVLNAVAKAGVHGFTKALALEVAKKCVTINTISPGYIGTKMVTAIPEEILNTKILPQIPVGRLGKPEEVAGLIIYLASEAAAFLTGANIAINGGQHMQ